ncbi:Ig-like domain-containing protein [Microbacterium sp. ARD31]|uniref:Ig-like domain-containing protein n=1 Tax=Microbacterium sp. ARD31 TaxID=2962576 RepID=UPI0028820C62|nr:Ig-like domain-containing protein [Microbacterium sp. ARD31]MDT0182708.1 Ig-like domain-containing protein [Microbacterium sp. ARD31]
MRAFAWLRARPRAIASASAVTASAVALTTMAFLYDGFPTTEVDLHDGGVWVTKQSSLLVGHFNYESRVLDGGLRTASEEYDILQSGDDIVVVDQAASSVTAIDPAMVTMTDSADVPGGAAVALGGTTVAILDPESGALWALPADGVGGFDIEGTEPVDTLGAGAALAVGTDGTVYAASSEQKELVTVPAVPDGSFGEPQRTELGDIADGAELAVTAVGGTAVVLDRTGGTLVSTGGLRADIADAETARLQQPSGASDAVAVATASTLVRAPLDGSEPVVVDAGAEGAPAEPVSLAGCTYGVWSGSASFIRDCIGEADDLATTVEGVDDDAELVFRVNRDVIVLNDIRGGSAWMAADDLQQVDNWDDITPPEGEAEENDEETTDETVETTLPERTDKNTVPEAVDDDFGVRPGRTTVLPVLDNDTDADGDILTVTLPDGGPSLGEVQTINNGAGLQIAVPESANGSARFPYRIDDGRGGSDTATVTLSVRPDTVNGAPSQKRTTSLQVEAGGVVTHNVLPDWIDPDGDDIFLSGVEAEPGDEVDFTPDGRITYRSINGVQGRKDIAITVSDTQKSTAGILRLDVRPVGSTSPVTNADHVVTRAGVPVEVSPLLNDLSTGREPLRLTRVDEVPGAAVVPDFSDSTFTFTSNAVGTYYVQYLASAGAKNALGVVRVDVLEDADEDAAPVAVRDVALLPSGGEVLVAALANDIDPAGGILVIQSVSIESDSGVSVSVLGHETLRVSDQGALSTQVTVKYTISNGIRSAEGEVVVIPVPGPEKLRPPVADDDKAVVRAGDVVTIPVLDNDYHPNGDTIHVAPDLVEPLPAADAGDIFVSQDTIRFKAGPEAGTVYATYEVVDSTGQKDAGYVTIQVLPVDEETNQTPRPRDVTARVLAGSQVRIPIPLDGIDADGDSVDLVGLASAPEKGRVVETGATYLEYQADVEASGTDTFTYRVRDRLGAESTATIRVGIAPPEARNQAPYAVKDTVVMRPGRSVAVPVLTNDSDPEGDAIGLVAGGLILPDVPGLEAEVLGDRVIVTSPDEELETSLQYTIRDARGAEAIAVLQVTVDEDVPLLRPIARDDRVLPEDVDGPTVDLEVLANDEDPDGTVAALTVEVDDPVAQARPDGTVRITLDDEEHLVTYTITDEDGQIASAFIRVPSLDDLPPTLITTTGIEVDSGETVEIPLSEHVRAAGDRDVVITEAAKVSAVHSNGAELVKDQRTLVYTSADGYYGQDAITFEVTDGTGPDDPEGRKATLTMPVTVRPPANQQPTFVDGEMNVAPGEDATGLDLRSLTTDPDEGDIDGMSYTVVGGAPAGLTASIEDGSTLRVGAAADTPKGTQATIGLRITDGETDPIEGTVVVTVTASTRPLATANDDVLPRVDQGSTVEVPVLDNDFNPFPETPLTLVSAVTQTGDGRAEVSGDRVAVSPSASFVGTMVVRYRVQDATGDPDREVEGLITITVQGRPDAPGTPTVSSVQDRTVVLAWTPPVDNGSPITGYTVSSTRGDYVKQCASTTCTLDGLTNNVEYNFTVVAANAVGESDPSPPSETARPDARPDTPQPPTLTFGDQSLNVAWQTPTTPGSPVETFTLEISPAPPSGVSQKTNVTGNTLVWEGLENGASYQVRVRAHNRAPEPSSWSGWSASEVPARAPEPVAAPSTQRLEPVGEQAQMQVSWSPPANNGAAISVYQLQVLRGGAVVNTIETSATSQAVVIETSTTDYTFRVRANNKAGWGEYGPNSAPRRAFVAPDAPTNVSARPGDRSLQMSFTEPDGNGATQSEMRYEYSLNGGNWQALAGNRLITGLNNGTDYQVRIRAYTALDGVRYNGAPSAPSAAQRPYGPVGTPSADASRSGRDITFSWGAPAPNGRAIQQVQIRIDGGGWQDVAKNGSRTNTYAYSTTHRIDVRAFDTEGQVSPIASAQATTVDEPRAVARTGKGSSVSRSDCTSASCAYLTLTVENFPAGSYNLSCEREGRTFVAARSYNVPRNGTIQLGCYFGYPGEQVWVRIHGWGDAQRITW